MSGATSLPVQVEHWIAPGLFAGAEQVVVGGAAALLDLGVDARVVVIREERVPHFGDAMLERLEARGVPSLLVTSRGRIDRAILTRMWMDSIRRRRSTLVHSHGIKATLLARAARRSVHVATHHGSTSRDLRARLYERLLLGAYRRADAVVAVSPVTGELLARDGVPTRRLHVIENFLSRDDLAPAASVAPAPPIELLFVGRLSVEKGLAVLLDAWARSPQPEAFALTVLGDGAEREALQTLAKSRGLGDRVRFEGYVADPSAAYARAHALVLPSYREGLPMTLLEAASAGLPIVASAVGGIPEALASDAGILAPPGDVGAWSRALDRLRAELPALTRAARDNAPAVRERFSPARWAAQTRDLYARLLEEAR